MKVGYRLFLFLFAFYAIVGAVYWFLGGNLWGLQLSCYAQALL